MYGLPARPLTYEEEVVLDLCMDRACRRLAKITAEALRVHAGARPDREWFVMDADDEVTGERRYEEALLAYYAARNTGRR